jgi:subtilisin family serine protease
MFVAAAGNSSSNNDITPHYPSSYGAANEIAVAATDQRDALASFSNWGARSVDLGAPGTNILSTIIGGQYAYFNGTSMATPHVTGAAALILSAPGQGGLTVAQLKSAILNNVDPLPSLAGLTVSGGRLNVCKAIPGCGGPPPPPTPTPTLTTTPVPTATPAPGTPTSTPTRPPVPTATPTPTLPCDGDCQN